MNQQTYTGAHPTTTNSITEQSTLSHMEQPARTGDHPTTTSSIIDQNSMSHMEQPARTGNHPTTVGDVSQQSSTHQPGVWMKKPEGSTMHSGSAQAEHGSDKRPVADKDAFIQPNETKKHWQSNMSPAERAKQLASEMDKTFEERRKSADEGDKLLKIGGKKEYKLE